MVYGNENIEPRGLYSPPPAFRPTFLDRPTLLITYWCSLCSIVIIFTRLVGRYVRMLKVYKDDWWMVASIIPLGIRLGLVHMVLIWGTNNMAFDGFEKFRQLPDGPEGISWDLHEEIRRRINGSKLVLASRVAYVAFLWSQKFCITEFHRKLDLSLWKRSYKGVLIAIRWSLIVTFVGTVISVFVECHPSSKYWQVVPDPGPQCRQGLAPLIVTAICNAVTWLVIVIFPLPPIFQANMPFKRKFFLVISLSLPLIPCALAIYKVPFVLRYNYSQPHRSLYSSIECLASCIIANAIVLNSFARDKGPKRNKFRGPGGADMMYTPEQLAKRGRGGDLEHQYQLDVQSMRRGMRVWGSDEDLVKDMGLGMNEDLQKMSDAAHHDSELSHPSGRDSSELGASTWEGNVELYRQRSESGSGRELITTPPPAEAAESSERSDTERPDLKRWTFPHQKNDSNEHKEKKHNGDLQWSNAHARKGSPSRKVSFLDVGGLLNKNTNVAVPAPMIMTTEASRRTATRPQSPL